MTPFWVGLFENLRGRGRNASLFIAALPALLVVTLIATQIPEEIYRHYILPTLPCIGTFVGFVVVRDFLRARARRRDRLQRRPLSDDELNKARTKLVRSRHRILNRPAP